VSNHTKIPIIRELGEQLSPTTVSVQPTARHRLHADDIPLEVEHGLAMTAAELLITDPDNAARKLLPSDLQRMAHVVLWALKRKLGGVSAEPAHASGGGPNSLFPATNPPRGRVERLEQRALQWAAADRAADDRAAELDRATETLGTSSGSGDIDALLETIVAYVEAQARARVAGKVEDDTREWLLETARALLP
jgi:hypothetical protein